MAFQLAHAYVQLSSRGIDGVTRDTDRARFSLRGLIGPAAAVAAGIAAVTAAAAAAGAKFVIMAAGVEQTAAQFKTLLGSQEAATKMMADIQKFAATTPFGDEGVTAAAKTLLSYQVAADQVLPTIQVMGDIAAATGADLGDLATIFGRVRAQGRLMTMELDQFNNRGIPMGAALAEMLGKTTAEVRKMASEGKISFGDMQRAMIQMTSQGGMAFGGMDDQANTLIGLWGELEDDLTFIMNDIGAALIEGFNVKGIIASISQFAKDFRGVWMPSIVDSINWMSESIVGPVTSALSSIISETIAFVSDIDLYYEYAYTYIGNWMSNAYQVVAAETQNMATAFSTVFSNILTIAKNFFTNFTAIVSEGMKMVIGGGDIQALGDKLFEGIAAPEWIKPQMDLLAGDMDRIAQRMADRQADRQKRLEDVRRGQQGDAIAAMEIEEGITAELEKQTKEKAKQSSFLGLAALAERMQNDLTASVMGNGQSSQLASIDQSMQALVGMARSGGIKIADQQSDVAVNDASIAFRGRPLADV